MALRGALEGSKGHVVRRRRLRHSRFSVPQSPGKNGILREGLHDYEAMAVQECTCAQSLGGGSGSSGASRGSFNARERLRRQRPQKSLQRVVRARKDPRRAVLLLDTSVVMWR